MKEKNSTRASTRKAIVPLLLLAACVGSHMANNHVRAAAKNNTKLQEVLKVLNGLDYFNPAAIHPQTHNYWNGDPEGWDKK